MSSCPSIPTGPRLPCEIIMVNQSDKSNEPPPQPRVRKVTTVINLAVIVVRDTPAELGVWLMSTCEVKTIPKTQPHMFAHCRLGTWLTIGVYPDGSLASFSPYAYTVLGHKSSVVSNRQLAIMATVKDLVFEKFISQKEIKLIIGGEPMEAYPYDDVEAWVYRLPGFGRIISHYDHQLITESSIWLEWCGDVLKEYRWCVNCIENEKEEEFTERELRDAAELIRNRELNAEFPEASDKVVARHYGMITEVNRHRGSLCVWSPNVSIELDHHARIPPPKHTDAESPMLPPLVGQWVQYDLKSHDIARYCNNPAGSRVLISEYLPITSPSGIGVLNFRHNVKIMISCILVRGTSHPFLFELPHFGFVLDRKAKLISGTHVQIVLERVTGRMRRMSGVCWTVQESILVDPTSITLEPLQHLQIQFVPLKDAMDISVISTVIERNEESSPEPSTPFQPPPPKPAAAPAPKPSNNPHVGVTTLKYQQPQHHQQMYPDNRRESYYSGPNIQMPNSNQNDRSNKHQYQKRQNMTYNGSSMEGTALVEKIHSSSKAGVLWMFEATQTTPGEADTTRNSPFTAHFVYSDDLDIALGDYLSVKLKQKEDATSKVGFRWAYVSSVKKPAPFHVQIKGGYNQPTLLIYDMLTASGLDKQNRQVFTSKRFPSVLDTQNLVPNPVVGTRFYASIIRKRVQSSNVDVLVFQWTLAAAAPNNYYVAAQPAFGFHRASTYSPRQYLHPAVPDVGRKTTASSESTSPPPLVTNSGGEE